ncbi:response regulator transcription factor [Actinomyces lilanjuaniae]
MPRLIDYALASVPDVDTAAVLSHRERDVLRLLCEGASNRQIASRLAIAEATVKTHVSALLGKTGARSRLEIVAWAFRHGYARTGTRASF